MKKAILTAICIFAFMSVANATLPATFYSGIVTNITVNPWNSNVSVLFTLSGQSECFCLDYNSLQGKAQLAQLLAAKSNGTSIKVYATGSLGNWSWCSTANNITSMEMLP
jgi:hypothetical protein